ncbi:MAG: thermonuclease family protein [Chloroflexota bacterium]|nr:thermonuclease family protein [Chloroflexota bacterium]
MRRRPHLLWLLLVAAWFAIPATASHAQTATPPVGALDQIPADAQRVDFVDVVDGDTIEVILGEPGERERIETVRLIGIDTPETNYSFSNEPECFGGEATRRTESLLVAADEVWLETDVRDRDRFDRLLRYVWIVTELPKGDKEIRLLNEALVREGYALARTYQPTTAHQDARDEAERAAIRAAAGMWLTCDASVSLDPALEDNSGPVRTPIDTTRVPPDVEADAACVHFDTFQQAQDLLALYPELADILDIDADGIACEGWFSESS